MHTIATPADSHSSGAKFRARGSDNEVEAGIVPACFPEGGMVLCSWLRK